MDPEALARVRSFNRSVTQRVGALEDAFLGRPRSLGASRLLFEIEPEGTEVRALRARLELDSGYLSRLLRALEREGLVALGPAEHDARVRVVTPTPRGEREVALLDRRAEGVAEAVLEPLGEKHRRRLVDAMQVVERLLRASCVRIDVEDAASAAAQRCVARYFEELAERFPTGFEPARSTHVPPLDLNPPRGRFVLARLAGEGVGCGGLKVDGPAGHITRMWVDPDHRGLGIGSRILEKLEVLAREQRLSTLRLETNGSLREAISLYRGSGYREVPAFGDEPYAEHWFEKVL